MLVLPISKYRPVKSDFIVKISFQWPSTILINQLSMGTAVLATITKNQIYNKESKEIYPYLVEKNQD
jgi:hypothetical protein